jgi:PIN domain nuclease of toxin-antitoxin system
MDLILDTHALVWIFTANSNINQKHLDILSQSQGVIFVSAVTAFEIATKYRIGKLPEAKLLYENFHSVLEDFNYIELPVKAEHGLKAGTLMGDHKDPFDRLLAAQSIVEGIPIMTIDARIRDLGAEIVW